MDSLSQQELAASIAKGKLFNLSMKLHLLAINHDFQLGQWCVYLENIDTFIMLNTEGLTNYRS